MTSGLLSGGEFGPAFETFARVVFNGSIQYDPLFHMFRPGVLYYARPETLTGVYDRRERTGLDVVAEVDAVSLPVWNGVDSLDDRRVVVHAPVHIGDALVGTSLLVELFARFRGVELAVLCSPGSASIYASSKLTGSRVYAVPAFLTADDLELGSTVLIAPPPRSHYVRGTTEGIYASLEIAARTPIAVHKPYIHITESDRAALNDHVGDRLPAAARSSYVFVHTTASETERTPAGWVIRLRVLRDAIPRGVTMVVNGEVDTVRGAMVGAGLVQDPSVVAFGRNPAPGSYNLSARSIAQLAMGAAVVVTPDTFVLHAAAANNVPTVALWNYGGGGSLADVPAELLEQGEAVDRDLEKTIRARAIAANPLVSSEDPTTNIPPPEARLSTYPNATALDMAAAPDALAENVLSLLNNNEVRE